MKKLLASFCALALGASVTQAQDWSGAYGGLTLGYGNGDITSFIDFERNGEVYGLFAGYNVQQGNLVFGGEIAYQGAGLDEPIAGNEGFDRLVDLKGRFGYSLGSTLVYAVVGHSMNQAFFFTNTSSGDGLALGLGAETRIGDRMFVGAEYLRRDMRNPEELPMFELDPVLISTFSLRLGMRF